MEIQIQPCGSDWETRQPWEDDPQPPPSPRTSLTPDFPGNGLEKYKKTFYWHKSGVDQLVLIYHCQVRQECPWIDLIFCTFFAHPPIFLPFLWPAACIVPSSKPISNNAPKMVATGSTHCNHLAQSHTLHHWMHSGLDNVSNWCNKAQMMMTIQENCIPDPPIHKWQMANQICLNLQIYFQASYMLQLISGTFFGPNSSKFV